MDQKTLDAYREKAYEYSQDWLAQPQPTDMYKLLKHFFKAEGETADIGCGNGRDSNWMVENGYRVTGYDSSADLLKLALQLYPKLEFHLAVLPLLNEIRNQFDNILCETVIMHLPKVQIPSAIQNLKRILKKNGILYLSWRVTEGEDRRHQDGRLYSSFKPNYILEQFSKDNVLHFEDKISASSSKRICRLICKNS